MSLTLQLVFNKMATRIFIFAVVCILMFSDIDARTRERFNPDAWTRERFNPDPWYRERFGHDAWEGSRYRPRQRPWNRERFLPSFGRCKYPDHLTWDCSNSHFTYVPHIPISYISSLLLNDNWITTINDDAFIDLTSLEFLNLRNNKLTHLSNRSFAGLTSLKTLDITQNLAFTIPTETLAPLASLKTLKLGKLCDDSECASQKLAFTQLTDKLESMKVSVPENFVFGEEFSHLQNLTTLLIHGHRCSLGNVSNETFAAFSNSLETLEVQNCLVGDLQPDSLQNFQKLETLNFACNRELNLLGVLESVKQMPQSTVKTLVLDGVHTGGNINQLTHDWFDSSRFANISRLSLRHTKIISVDLGFGVHLPNLESLNFGYNTVLELQNRNHILFRNLKSVDFSHMNLPVHSSATFRDRYCHGDEIHSDDFFRKPPQHIIIPDHIPCCNHAFVGDFSSMRELLTKNVPKSLLFLYASNMGLPNLLNLTISSDNNILYFDVSGNQMKKIEGTIQGMQKLQGLDVSRCDTNYITPQFFRYFPSLTYLNMSSNELTDTPWNRLFEHARNLRVLDISKNRLRGVPENVFASLSSLETARLSDNPLGNVFINLRNNDNLKMLDLRSTSLVVSDRFRKELDDFQKRTGRRLQLKLGGNTFTCDCNNINFLKWLRETDVVDFNTLKCNHYDNLKLIGTVDVTILSRSCTKIVVSNGSNWYIDLFIGLIASVVVISLIIIIFTYWWSAKMRAYLLKSLRRRWAKPESGISELENPNVKYHAFVSCERTDGDWVLNTLVPEIEGKWGIQLCLSQRDFIAGMYILNTITEAIELCPYVIMVVSPSSVNNEACDFTMRMSMAVRRPMIFIRKDKLDPEKMNKTIKAFVFSPDCLEYDETEEGNAIFWEKLKERLMMDPAEAKKNLHPEYTADVVKKRNFYDMVDEKCEYDKVL